MENKHNFENLSIRSVYINISTFTLGDTITTRFYRKYGSKLERNKKAIELLKLRAHKRFNKKFNGLLND